MKIKNNLEKKKKKNEYKIIEISDGNKNVNIQSWCTQVVSNIVSCIKNQSIFQVYVVLISPTLF